MMNEPKTPLHQSGIARRLAGKAIFLATVPVIATAAMLGYISRGQIVGTARAMEQIQTQTALEGHNAYQRAGRQALEQSGKETQVVAQDALQSVSRKMAAIQDRAIAATAQNSTELNRRSFEGVVRQSARANRAALDDARDETTRLLDGSARDTQRRGAARIEAAMLAQVDTRMQERAHALSRAVSDRLADAKNYLKLTAQMPDMREGRAAGQKNILDALVRRFPQISQISALDKTGRETAMSAADRAVTPSDLGQRSQARYFQAGKNGAEYLADDGLPARNGAPTLQIAVPIEAYHGKVVGVLQAQYALSDLWDEIRAVRIGEAGSAGVQDDRGLWLLAPRPASGDLLTRAQTIDALNWRVVAALPRDEAMRPIGLLKRDISRNAANAQREMQRKIQDAAQTASVRLQRDSHQRQAAAERLEREQSRQSLQKVRETTAHQMREEIARLQTALQAQTQQKQQDSNVQMNRAADAVTAQMTARAAALRAQALQSADRKIVVIAFLLTVVSSALGTLLALVTASRIARPVAELARMTHAIADGDLDKRVNEDAPDELGALAASFNAMSDSLRQSRAELREAEGQVVQSAKLASLGELSAGVAHELNQPLAIIRGVAQQLQDEPGLSADVLSDLELIEGQTGRMIKIIQHMRTFCRVGNGELSEINLNKVVEDCFLLIGQQIRAHGVAVTLELCDNSPEVLGDANELEQVFINLVGNARDALSGRPDAQIILRSYVEGDQFTLEVRDNGPGVPAEILTRIFDPFYTTKEPGKGTGLGLSISHTLVTKHKGTLQVHNEGGAVFTVRLPLAPPQSAALPLAA